MTDKPIKRKQFFALMGESYRAQAKAEGWRDSELAMTLATMDTRLKSVWNKTRKAQLTESDVRAFLKLDQPVEREEKVK